MSRVPYVPWSEIKCERDRCVINEYERNAVSVHPYTQSSVSVYARGSTHYDLCIRLHGYINTYNNLHVEEWFTIQRYWVVLWTLILRFEKKLPKEIVKIVLEYSRKNR